MANISSPAVKNGTRRDFRESWKLLKSNYRAFLGIELFAIGAFLLIVLGLFAIESLVDPNFAFNFSRDVIQSMSYRVVIIAIGFILLTTFINCQTGLAYDVMSSGEMFTEFRSAFSYFRQHWWKYILISFMMGGMGLSINAGGLLRHPEFPGSWPPWDTTFGIFIMSVAFVISFLWQSLFVQSLASINAQGSLIRSIRESFRIFRANPKRVLSTWGLYYLIFIFPSFLFELILGILTPPLEESGFIVGIFFLIDALIVIFIGLPMHALLVTGLYNNIEFRRFPTKPEPTRKHARGTL